MRVKILHSQPTALDPGRVKTAGREVSNDRGVSAVPIAEVGMFQPLW